MAPVTLAVIAERKALGFDMDPAIGDVVTVAYDFGVGPVKVTGTYEGKETRDSGEVFIWVREYDGTRYAIPVSFVEVTRVEATTESLPLAARPAQHRPAAPKTRHSLDQSHHRMASYGRACARLDYEGRNPEAF